MSCARITLMPIVAVITVSCIAVVRSAVTLEPSGTVPFRNGESVLLKCKTTEETPVEWYYLESPAHQTHTVFNYGVVINGFRGRVKAHVNVTTGEYSIEILQARPSDAGDYTCVDDEGVGPDEATVTLVLYTPAASSDVPAIESMTTQIPAISSTDRDDRSSNEDTTFTAAQPHSNDVGIAVSVAVVMATIAALVVVLVVRVVVRIRQHDAVRRLSSDEDSDCKTSMTNAEQQQQGTAALV